MYELNERVSRLLEQKVEEVINKGDISPSEMCCIKDAYETMYYMQALETMNDYGEDSYRGNNSYGMYPNNWNMDSMRRGRGANGQFVSRGNSYDMSRTNGGNSRHSVNDRIIANLEKELDYAQSDFERQKIMDEIRRIREMKD